VPTTTAELLNLLHLNPQDEHTFIGSNPRTLMQRTYGGQVLAQALMAGYGTVDDDRTAHSLHAYFLRPGAVDAPITYSVEMIRTGGTFATRRIRATQDDREIFTMSSSFHKDEPGLDHGDPEPQQVPAPEKCPKLSDVMNARFGKQAIWREWDALDVRYVGDSAPGGSIKPGRHLASMRIWVRSEAKLPNDHRIHQAVLAYLSDLTLLSVSTVPHPVVFMSDQMQTASIDHAMWFHRDFKADEWLLYDMFSPSASSALGFSNGRLFQEGHLVASCAQEGLIRRVERRAILS
jgi:acyl-CoA thioesterase-2